MLPRFIVLAGFYLLCLGQVSAAELGVALLGGGGAALLSLAQRRVARRRFGLRGLPWRPFLALPGAVLRESLATAGALLRAVAGGPPATAGTIQRQPFLRGDDAPEAAARRALVLLGLSIAPNGFVLDEAAEEQALPVHRLKPRPPAADPRWPL